MKKKVYALHSLDDDDSEIIYFAGPHKSLKAARKDCRQVGISGFLFSYDAVGPENELVNGVMEEFIALAGSEKQK
ncbi:MAG: hypothetical protein AAF216_13760 [Pseudomonadota bacterium]